VVLLSVEMSNDVGLPYISDVLVYSSARVCSGVRRAGWPDDVGKLQVLLRRCDDKLLEERKDNVFW